MKTLEQISSDIKEAYGAYKKFIEGIVDENGNPRDMSAEELKTLGEHEEKMDELERQMEAIRKAQRISARMSKPADGEGDGESETRRVEPQVRKEPEKFKSFGEQLQAIASAGMNKEAGRAGWDRRLTWQKASGANEAVPSEGGFLVQTDFSTRLMDLMHDMGQVVGRTTRITISTNANGINLPAVDETSRADGSRWGGISAQWVDEANTATAAKPKLRNIELRLNKLMGVGYATEELLQDAAVMETIYTQGFTEELTFRTEDAIFQGNGAGKPLGILNSGALISVAKESGQAAATIVTQNILKMFNRIPARSQSNCVWFVNQEVMPQLWTMTLGSGTAVVLLYRPPGVDGPNANNPYGTLLGRPVIPVEYAAALGTVGDIVLADMSQYIVADKGGIDSASSMHVRFLYDEMTFRFTYRVDGQPTWRSALTPANGTNTLSPYVALATRS